MSTRSLVAALAIALVGTSAFAQPTPAQSAASAPARAASTMPMHDHGAERGAPMARSHMAASAASKAASGTKSKRHDHAKFNKNQ